MFKYATYDAYIAIYLGCTQDCNIASVHLVRFSNPLVKLVGDKPQQEFMAIQAGTAYMMHIL